MITKEELTTIKGRVGILKPYHQRIRALSENAYRLLAHDMPLLIAAVEGLTAESKQKQAKPLKSRDSNVNGSHPDL